MSNRSRLITTRSPLLTSRLSTYPNQRNLNIYFSHLTNLPQDDLSTSPVRLWKNLNLDTTSSSASADISPHPSIPSKHHLLQGDHLVPLTMPSFRLTSAVLLLFIGRTTRASAATHRSVYPASITSISSPPGHSAAAAAAAPQTQDREGTPAADCGPRDLPYFWQCVQQCRGGECAKDKACQDDCILHLCSEFLLSTFRTCWPVFGSTERGERRNDHGTRERTVFPSMAAKMIERQNVSARARMSRLARRSVPGRGVN
ncbi:hypothetical protein BJ170DRAFT_457156 [Xylariales sp. AK1849]|nr:hypothetical protein BJ170DRAFT_457156 [Xylariales sp. AK1849]